MSRFDLVSRILFPTPDSSYDVDDFPEELIWIPRNLDPQTSKPEECMPAILLSSPSARFFILYLHSNAEDLGRCYAFCSLLRHQFQVHVLAIEYPGYGICPGGQADEDSVTENARVGFRFLREVLRWPLDGIFILGRSIGCGPALAIAVEHDVNGVILVCPFLSVQELGKDLIGPFAQFLTERFPNKDRVPLLRSPLLVVHGKKDTVVPCTHGVKLFHACRSRKRLVCPENMEHNTNLHADANYFVLPMLQFFALPDYCFEEMRLPRWIFDKRMSPRYSDQPAKESSNPKSGGMGHRTDHSTSLGAFRRGSHQSKQGSGRRSLSTEPPSHAMSRLLPQPQGDFGADCKINCGRSSSTPPMRGTNSFYASSGRRVPVASRNQLSDIIKPPEKVEVPKQTQETGDDNGDASVEEAAAAAVQRFLDIKGMDGLKAQQPPELVIGALDAHQAQPPELVIAELGANQVPNVGDDEPPTPPDDCGFIKVPRTLRNGPSFGKETVVSPSIRARSRDDRPHSGKTHQV